MAVCKQKMKGARQLPIEDGWIGVRQLQVDNMCTRARQLAFSALELDNSKLSARKLDNS